MRMTALGGGNVKLAALGMVIENRGVIAAVKVGVCFDIKMPGKEPAAITQSYCQYVAGPGSVARPALKPRLQPGAERDCRTGQKRNEHPGTHAGRESESHFNQLNSELSGETPERQPAGTALHTPRRNPMLQARSAIQWSQADESPDRACRIAPGAEWQNKWRRQASGRAHELVTPVCSDAARPAGFRRSLQT